MRTSIYDPFYISLRNFTALTGELIRTREFSHLGSCFKMVEKLLVESEPSVKKAICGTYIPSLYAMLSDCDWRREVIGLFPVLLLKEYVKQGSEPEVKCDISVFKVWLN